MNTLLQEVGIKDAAARLIKAANGRSIYAIHLDLSTLETAIIAGLQNHPEHLADLAHELMGLTARQAIKAINLANDTIMRQTPVDPTCDGLASTFHLWNHEARLAGAYEAA